MKSIKTCILSRCLLGPPLPLLPNLSQASLLPLLSLIGPLPHPSDFLSAVLPSLLLWLQIFLPPLRLQSLRSSGPLALCPAPWLFVCLPVPVPPNPFAKPNRAAVILRQPTCICVWSKNQDVSQPLLPLFLLLLPPCCLASVPLPFLPILLRPPVSAYTHAPTCSLSRLSSSVVNLSMQ